jgi:hypothetical protein
LRFAALGELKRPDSGHQISTKRMTPMKRTLLSLLAMASLAAAQVTLPEGTKVLLRLEQTVSSESAKVGQPIEFTVTEDVTVDEQVVIAQGSNAFGTVIEAQGKRRMGRGGKLDFTIERVRGADGKYVPVRYTQNVKKGGGRGLTTGIVAAGIAFAVPVAAPLALLIKGKEVAVPTGTPFTVFTSTSYSPKPKASAQQSSATLTLERVNEVRPSLASREDLATVNVKSAVAGADIELDGVFVGNTPASLKVAPGKHRLVLSLGSDQFARELVVTSGSVISVVAPPNDNALRTSPTSLR